MQKSFIAVLILLAAGAVSTEQTLAQQTPAAGSQQSSTTSQTKPATAKPAQTAPAKKPAAAAPTLTTDRDKESYALGMNIAKGLKAQPIDVDTNLMLRGIKDTLSGAKSLLSDQEAAAELAKLQSDVRQKQEAERKELAEKNLREGQAFLAANKTKEGVVTLPSGLQYKILTEGTGPKPTANDTVVCQYRGTLVDGTEFDSSAKHGGPATFPVGRIIKGWTEALQLMPVGSKWQLVIPPDLAYADRGAGNVIGPNAVLIFEIELLSIKSTAQQPGPSSAPNTGTAPAPAPAPTQNK